MSTQTIGRPSLKHFNMLSDDQRQAFDWFEEYGVISGRTLTADDHQMMALKGNAGSGKTTLARAIVEYCQDNDIPVRATATTNQAVYVLKGKLDLPDEHVCTIHSLLGLRMVPDNSTGGLKLKNDRSQEPNIPYSGVVLIDEASQTPSALFEEIQLTADQFPDCSFLFIGDPAQLPPVGEEMSPAMTQVPGAKLEKIHRQAAENPIIQAATAVRNGEPWRHLAQFNPDTKQGISLMTKRNKIMSSAYNAFKSDTYKEDPLHARILCAKNKTVRDWNRKIHRAIYGTDADEFQPGQWVIAQDAWVPHEAVVLTTSELIKISKCYKTEASFMGWEGYVWDFEGSSYYNGYVSGEVVAAESKASYDAQLKRFLKTAKKNGGSSWGTYYDFMQRYADIRPAYASTIHKAQGTTLDQAYYIDRDVQNWPTHDGDQRPQLRYVALTRASKRMMALV